MLNNPVSPVESEIVAQQYEDPQLFQSLVQSQPTLHPEGGKQEVQYVAADEDVVHTDDAGVADVVILFYLLYYNPFIYIYLY